jgi:probable phosphoglycerate mutase
MAGATLRLDERLLLATLIFMRHGETLSNRERRFQGQLDIELNEIGRLQAQQAAKRLAGEGISIIYSSDLRRAAESAEIVAAALDIPLVTDRRLRERHLGVLQGITVAEAEVQYPEELKNWRAGDVVFFAHPGQTYPWHVAIVSDKKAADGVPLILHGYPPFWSETYRLDSLGPIHSHFRMEKKPKRA